MFDPAYPLSAVRPADYNPRAISDEARAALDASLAALGCLKPIIVTDAGRLIAGHQRTRAMMALSQDTAPAHILSDVMPSDEIRFNQLHNASDLECTAADIRVTGELPMGWHTLAPERVTGTLATPHANEMREICRLLAKYGPWGAAIVTTSGEAIVSALYAIACRVLRMPLHVYVAPDHLAPGIRARFGREYGTYSYDHLERTTWAQALAQIRRRNPHGRRIGSVAYDRFALPRLEAGMRVLDFGAGYGDYARSLAADGVDIHALEFYPRVPGTGRIDVGRAHADIDALAADLRARGPFDMVVCDSVLNSVDSDRAERAVLHTLSALTRRGGAIIVSGRHRTRNYQHLHSYRVRRVECMDRSGLTAMYRHGVWTYQKFHTLPQLETLARDAFGAEYGVYGASGRPLAGCPSSGQWCIVATNARHLTDAEMRAAIQFEFNLPLPGDRSFERHLEILAALSLPA